MKIVPLHKLIKVQIPITLFKNIFQQAKQSSVEESSVDRGSSDVDDPVSSREEETESWTPKWANDSTSVLTNRVRELRSRFVCSSERTYNRQGI